MAHLIDRRENAPNKSAVNRARFLRRYKEQIRRAVHDMVSERSITDMDRGGNVSVPRKDISEPVFRHGAGGDPGPARIARPSRTKLRHCTDQCSRNHQHGRPGRAAALRGG